MSISGISNMGSTNATQRAGTDFRSRMQTAMNAVANKLGMSSDDLKSALKSGKTLTDVAAAKGMSKDDLIATIKQSVTSSGTPLSDSQATQLATRMANHKGGHHHHHGGGATPTAAASSPTDPTGTSSSTGSTTGQILSQLA